jgi:hypothetical protein
MIKKMSAQQHIGFDQFLMDEAKGANLDGFCVKRFSSDMYAVEYLHYTLYITAMWMPLKGRYYMRLHCEASEELKMLVEDWIKNGKVVVVLD